MRHKMIIDETKVENVDYVVCKICGLIREDLSQHITKTHKITTEEYKEKYSINIICSKKKEKRGLSRVHNKPVKCKFCEETFKTEEALFRHYSKVQDKQHANEYFKDAKNDVDYVECKICGLKRKKLDMHIESIHNMSTEEYKKKYNVKNIICESNLINNRINNGMCREENRLKVSGSGNGFFGKHHTDEVKEQISESLKEAYDNGFKLPWTKSKLLETKNNDQQNYINKLISENVKFEYNKKSFKVVINDKSVFYYPYLFLSDDNKYVDFVSRGSYKKQIVDLFRGQYKEINLEIIDY